MTDPSTLLLNANLKQLKLPTMLAEHDKLAREAAERDEPYHAYLLRLTELEVTARTANAVAARIRAAGFPVHKEFDTFDCPFPRFGRSFGGLLPNCDPSRRPVWRPDFGDAVVPVVPTGPGGRPHLLLFRTFLGPRLDPARFPSHTTRIPPRAATMGEERWFTRAEHDWAALVERIKRTPCPHCRVVGALIRHGSLHAFDDTSPRRKTLRARRLFCSNRGRRPGCGRTVSVWLASKIRRLSVTTHSLGAFLRHAIADGLAAAIRATKCRRSDRTWQRLWTRFDRAQSRIRTALLACPFPRSGRSLGGILPNCRPSGRAV